MISKKDLKNTQTNIREKLLKEVVTGHHMLGYQHTYSSSLRAVLLEHKGDLGSKAACVRIS